jgi:Flp pilus assembly protein TadD
MHLRWPGLVLSSSLALLAQGCAAPQTGCRIHAAYSGMCAEELAKGNLEAAEAHCDQGLALYLEYPDLWHNKGLIYMERKDWGAAKHFMATALRYNPDHPWALSNLGVMLLHEGASEQALESFTRALKVHPGFLGARLNRAVALMKLERFDEARTELHAVLAADSSGADSSGAAHHSLGIIDFRERKLQAAAEHLSQGVMLTPDSPALWHDLGTVLKEQGRLAEAAEAFGHCVRLDAKNPSCRDGLETARRGAPP